MLQLQVPPEECKNWITFAENCQDPIELQKILDFVNTPYPERVLTQFEIQVLTQIAKNPKASSNTLLDLSRRINYKTYSDIAVLPISQVNLAIDSFHYDLILHPNLISEVLIEINLITRNSEIKKHVLSSGALDPLHRELIELGLT